jgi:RNA polymerase sigma factor (sigma-70 family)
MTSIDTVFVIDDDQAVRDSLELLVRSVELPVATFASGSEFMDSYRPDMTGCLVLDVRMPGLSGIELQSKLGELDCRMPIIFITGHADVPMAVKALKAGATDFVEKPFNDQELLDKIHHAFEQNLERRQEAERSQEIRKCIEHLTPRESEVLELVVDGASNKLIAQRLELSQRTVEIHRAQVMRKMQADSLAQLVRMVVEASEDDATT